MDADAIYGVLKNGTAEARQALRESLPPDPLRDLAAGLLGSNHPGMVIVALGPVAISYCNGAAPEVGAALTLALHTLAVELITQTSDHGLMPATVSGFALNHVKALNLLGRSAEAAAFAGDCLPLHERLGDTVTVRGIKLGRIEALLNLNRLDEASSALADPALPGDAVNDIELTRLQGRLRRLLAPISQDRPKQAAVTDTTADDALMKRALDALSQLSSGLPGEEQLKSVVQGLVDTPSNAPTGTAGYEQLLRALRQGEDFMSKGGAADSQITVRGAIREACAIFARAQAPGPSDIQASLAVLEDSLRWARAHSVVELQNDALYGIYLCHSRLKAPSPAADALLALRSNLEATRSAITDVTRRGGAFGLYPHLFGALCEKLHTSGRVAELLEAIEASKGRGVADLLTQRSGIAAADVSIYGAAARLPDLCRQHGFHYLTYFVDDECTYAVLVTSAGAVHAPAPVPLGKSLIRQAAADITPAAAVQLSPLVECLAPFIADGTVRPGSHVCVAPDDDIANVPFACLTLAGAPLADTLSVSRIHNALHLQHLLEHPAARPSSYLGIVVPALGNVSSPTWPEMRANLYRPIDRVAGYVPGDTMEGEAVTVDALARHDLTGRIVHFSSHGTFPRRNQRRTPFEHSGLVLADGESLPDAQAIDIDMVLTPRAILERNLHLTGSHISMMACVSGLSREGIGGDALGMEWAMLQGGAASVLSTHWDVSAKLAAAFLDVFYEQWLGKQQSRAQALAATVAALRTAGGPLSDVASWAAFSLTGDWR